jgi:hypothetical protein
MLIQNLVIYFTVSYEEFVWENPRIETWFLTPPVKVKCLIFYKTEMQNWIGNNVGQFSATEHFFQIHQIICGQNDAFWFNFKY